MKVTVRDPAVLRALGPIDVAAYLRSTGWSQTRRIGDRGAAWTRTLPIGEIEILLPLNRQVGDFVTRMSEVLNSLEIAEQRSQMEILHDLMTTSSDIIRIRAHTSESSDGTISIEEGVDLVHHAREMVLAAARAATRPSPYFHARKPAEVVEYMEKVRLGQTERGSYVITLLSRVPPILAPTKEGQGRLEIEDPFERRVTRTLASALAAIRDAVQDSVVTGQFEAFQRAVQRGVSANLCDAVAALAGGSANARDIEVDLTWSSLRPQGPQTPRRISLPADAIPTIEEAGRIFRETSPRDDFELLGLVIGLYRPDPAQSGRVTIWGPVEGTPRRVSLILTGTEYDLAWKAHGDRRLVRCSGQLVKSGTQYELLQPRCLELAEDE